MSPRVIPFRATWDDRGGLHVCELGDALPFPVKRFFLLTADHRDTKRGGYANMRQSEMLVAIAGQTTVKVDGRDGNRSFVLVSPQFGLYLPPMTWCEVTIARRSQLLVLASDVYNADEHIADIPSYNEAQHAA